MSRILGLLKRLIGFSSAQSKAFSEVTGYQKPLLFSEGDRVLINGSKLSKPLQKGSNTRTQFGRSSRGITIPHDSIIGRSLAPFTLPLENGVLQRIEYPTLDQYVSLTPRLVTPIYSSYAAHIVNLLDFHPPYPTEKTDSHDAADRLEILEAGTGHGSLTLQLARAIAVANPPPPAIKLPQIRDDSNEDNYHTLIQKDVLKIWDKWRETRRAIVHTVENIPANRIHAEMLIRGFRQGLYWPHVDFYVSDVRDWVKSRFEKNACGSIGSQKAFLDYAILDLPGVHDQFPEVQKAMRSGATLVAFTPSITQIGECVRIIQEMQLPLVLDQVVELGEGISTGRKWDVRLVNPRKRNNLKADTVSQAPEETDYPTENAAENEKEDNASEEKIEERTATKPVLVCRPKVGERTIGGGFIGIWKKLPD